jgi:hypothetical protein
MRSNARLRNGGARRVITEAPHAAESCSAEDFDLWVGFWHEVNCALTGAEPLVDVAVAFAARFADAARRIQAAAEDQIVSAATLYRGESHRSPAALRKRYRVGGTVTLDRLTSCTPDPELAVCYTRGLPTSVWTAKDLHIPDTRGPVRCFVVIENTQQQLRGVRVDSELAPRCGEIVLPRGARFRVTSLTKRRRPWLYRVDLEPVTDKGQP